MNDVIEKENVKIENLVYSIRGQQVMLDSDLAKLYKTETKRINEAVRRNFKKFPDRFSWILTENDLEILRSQFATSRMEKKHGGRRFDIRVFNEQGITMLATVLKTDVAINVTIVIMDVFSAMRKYISNNMIEQKYYNDMVIRHDSEIKLLQDALSNFKEKNNHIFFDGQIYDAYSIMIDIINTSKNEIIIIDNYVDKNILDILSKTNKNIILITNQYNNNDYNKYQKQYNNIKLVINNKIHDRFIIIDKKGLYHCGASFKDLGKKCFAITKIDDDDVLKSLLNNI